jgi:hypothetical protein
MGNSEHVEIQPMTAAEIRQYFNEHSKKTHQLAIQLNQLMNHRLPQTTHLTGPGMVSFSAAAGIYSVVLITSPVTLSPHRRNFHWHLKIHMYYTQTAFPTIF